MKVLHIDSSILGDGSASRALTRAIVERLKSEHREAEVTYLDLAAEDLPHLSHRSLARSDESEAARNARALEQFLGADVLVIGAPIYNFSIPSQLKAWIDRIAVAGKTFRYTANGSEGLAGNKRVIVAVSRGGLYSPGMPAAAFEHVESYLRGVFGFLGVTDLEIVIAEGLQIGPEQREKAMSGAMQVVTDLRPAAQLRAA